MDNKEFKSQYGWSASLFTVFSLFLFVWVIYLVVQAAGTIINSPNSSSFDADNLYLLFIHLIFFSIGTIFCLSVMLITMIWNIYVCYKRSVTINQNKLFWIGVGSWIIPFFIPILGTFISFYMQVWCWKHGGKEEYIF